MIFLISLLFLHIAFLQVNGVYTQADSISDSVLRLRILANSDTMEDQDMKLKLKAEVCAMLQPWLEKCDSKEEAVNWICQHMDWIRHEIGVLLKQLYETEETALSPAIPASKALVSKPSLPYIHTDTDQLPLYDVQLTSSLFPTRTYGELTFPPGYYDTLLITLGEGKGHNWWCVLYPSLCFLDETCADFPEESKNQLQDTLSEADYEALQEGVTFRFRIVEILGNFYEKLHSVCTGQNPAILSH